MPCLGMHAACHCVRHEKTNKFAVKHFTRIQIFLEILHFLQYFLSYSSHLVQSAAQCQYYSWPLIALHNGFEGLLAGPLLH